MDKRLKIHLLLLSAVFLYSLFCVPEVYALSGGSCNQGIEVFFIAVILMICSLLCLLAIILATKKEAKSAKFCAFVSVLIWGFFCLNVFSNDSLPRLLYSAPFLIVNILILHLCSKLEKEERLIKMYGKMTKK